MDAPESKLEVIRKLLAKAERTATQAEADAYNEKAAELMARHGVDAAMLAAAGEAPRDVIGSRRIAMTDPYSAEKATLAGRIAYASGCRSVRHLGLTRRQVDAVTVLGFQSDLERVDVLYTSLLVQATRGVVQQRPAWGGESVAAFRRTWLIGFANAVTHRLMAANHRAVAEHDAAATAGPSAALVVVARSTMVKKAFDEQYGHLKAGRPRQLSGSGYAAGQSAGRWADIGQNRIEGSGRALER
jgi:hypothetical protein